MGTFSIAHKLTQKSEGIYSVDPTDKGGETVFGISRKNFPKWEGWKEVDRLKKANATSALLTVAISNNFLLQKLTATFYKSEFWDFLKLDQVANQDLCNELFDAAVNLGKGTVAKFLQQSLNLLNNNQQLYADLEVDGAIGQKTIVALQKYLATASMPGRSVQDVVMVLLKSIDSLQTARYNEICKNNPSQEKYYFGWLKNR